MIAGRARIACARAASLFARERQPHVVIFGHQKSGTSAIAGLLAEYGQLGLTQDIRVTWGPWLAGALSGDAREATRTLAQRYRWYFRSALLKEPNLTFVAKYVQELFPSALLIYVVRDPRQTVRSFLNRIGLSGDRVATPADARLSSARARHIFDPRLSFNAHNNYIGALALRWKAAAEAYHSLAKPVTLVRYEDFVRDKEQFISQLGVRLGVERKKDIRPLLSKQFQPAGDRRLHWRDFFGANYEHLYVGLGDVAGRFGYELPDPSDLSAQ